VNEMSELKDNVMLNDFDLAFAQYDRLMKEWLTRCKSVLLKLLPYCKGVPSNVERLYFATTLFECKHCIREYNLKRTQSHNSALSLEQVLEHRCHIRPDPNTVDNDTIHCIYSRWYTSPWNYFNSFAFDHGASKRMSELLTLFGLDAETATFKEVRALDICVVCPRCEDCKTRKYDSKYTWSRAVGSSYYGRWLKSSN
jgi:hypothetical protein